MRLFIAINLSDELKKALLDTQRAMQARGVRGNYSPEENLHLTLAFIGEYPEAEPVLDALRGLSFAPFALTLDGIGCFGDLWWAGIRESAPLAAVARRVRRALAEHDIPFDRKRFSPHITLVRKASRDAADVPVAPESVTVNNISLMRSDQGRNGMIYTELGKVEATPPQERGLAMDTFRTSERAAWRRYLAEHFETEEEVWFVFPNKETGEQSLSYNDAVEEALCFGWIDSTNRRLDEQHCIRRFSPRKKGSAYSQPNIERLKWLEAQGLIHPKIRESVLPVIQAPFVFPEDILAALREDETVWKNYQQFSAPYQRIRVAYIEAARNRPEEFQKRLKSFLEKTRRNKLIMGYGGIEKYYG